MYGFLAILACSGGGLSWTKLVSCHCYTHFRIDLPDGACLYPNSLWKVVWVCYRFFGKQLYHLHISEQSSVQAELISTENSTHNMWQATPLPYNVSLEGEKQILDVLWPTFHFHEVLYWGACIKICQQNLILVKITGLLYENLCIFVWLVFTVYTDCVFCEA